MKQHEGCITVDSKVDKGTTFDIYLPGFFGDSDQEEDGDLSLEDLQGSGKRILVVEDEKTVREYVTKGLNKSGYDVYSASNAEEAMTLFEDKNGDFDLVVSDVVLPDTNGVELVNQLQTMKPKLRILLSSGYTDHKSQWTKIQNKGFRFLQKPYDLMDLLRAVSEEINA